MAAHRQYPDELRERAVRLVRESGCPMAQIARDLGVHREALRGWVARPRPMTAAAPSSCPPPNGRRSRRYAGRTRSCIGPTTSSKRPRLFRRGARPSPDEAVAVIDHLRDRFGVGPVCRVLDLPPPSARH
ncbi:transposase [Planotetraspora sp. GP83]|uniref:transposase n=1 Tax=Planotetraspora sp. GP83 TaxID=3156264 RepID=UPI003514348B